MKSLFFGILLAAGLTSSAFATTTFNGSETTCSTLQAALQADGSITIEHALGENTYYANSNSCPTDFHAVPAFEGSADTHFCRVGYVCAKNPRGGHDFAMALDQADFAAATGLKYSCYATPHNSVHTHPSMWGDDAPTLELASTSAVKACTKENGWGATCRVTACITKVL